MRVLTACIAACALALVSEDGLARELSVATVTPQGVACVFTPSCAVAVTDSIGYFTLFGDAGSGKLLTRTYPGMAGTQAAGLTGYSFYIDMRGAQSLGSANCVDKLVLDAGPVVPLKYTAAKTADMFMVGAPTGAAISSASQNGTRITIRFAKEICPGSKTAIDSLYFGFAAKAGPIPSKAEITGSLEGTVKADVRVPKH